MKKIVISIFVLAFMISSSVYAREIGEQRRGADDGTSNSTSTHTLRDRDSLAKLNKNVDIACVATAVSKREDAILTAWTSMNTKVTSILTARKEALLDAWEMSDAKQRQAEIKKAHLEARKAKKTAGQELKKVKKEAWATFKKEVKSCGGSVGSEASGESESAEKVEI